MKKGWFKFDVTTRALTPVETPEASKGCQSLAYDAANRAVIALARKPIDDRTRTVVPWALDVTT
ncbi:MAG: hypothetical protein AMS14_08980, partial [Planctomycetes bacterium DG_20]